MCFAAAVVNVTACNSNTLAVADILACNSLRAGALSVKSSCFDVFIKIQNGNEKQWKNRDVVYTSTPLHILCQRGSNVKYTYVNVSVSFWINRYRIKWTCVTLDWWKYYAIFAKHFRWKFMAVFREIAKLYRRNFSILFHFVSINSLFSVHPLILLRYSLSGDKLAWVDWNNNSHD